jgi:hypothetical protein
MNTHRFGRKLKLPSTVAIKHQIRRLMSTDLACTACHTGSVKKLLRLWNSEISMPTINTTTEEPHPHFSESDIAN